MIALSGIREALGWLTVVPVRTDGSSDPVPWFTWVGLIFGALALGVALPVSAMVPGELGALLAGVGAIAAWSVATGMLHLDGLADSFDALVGSKARDERLRIMRDSRIGSFGASGVALTLMAAAVSAGVAVRDGAWGALAFAPIAGRWSASLALSTIKPARTEGLAALLAGPRSAVWHAVSLPPLALVAFLARGSMAAVVAGVVAAVLVPRALSHRVGGLTGDIVGASVMLVETATLLAAALSARWSVLL